MLQSLKIIRKQDDLVKAYEEYIKLLGEEIDELCNIAFTTGWESTRYSQGEKCRKRINFLQKEIDKLKVL